MSGDFTQPGREVEAADQRGSENDSGENFADYSGLAELHEEKAEQVRESYEKKEKKEDGSEVGVGHSGRAAGNRMRFAGESLLQIWDAKRRLGRSRGLRLQRRETSDGLF